MQAISHKNATEVNFFEDFCSNSQLNEEIKKWLSFVYKKDSKHYQTHKNRAKKSESQRDQLLGEYKAVYFIGERKGGNIVAFEPSGQGNKKLDFQFRDKSGVEWFAEVKSPSWRSEVVKKIEREYLKRLRGSGVQMRIDVENRWIGKTLCPICGNSIEIQREGFTIGIHDEQLKNAYCGKCKKSVWKLTQNERANAIKQALQKKDEGELRWFNGGEAVEDAIKKAVTQFDKGKNNLLIITPDMLASAVFLSAMDSGAKVEELLQKYDTECLISCVLILELSLQQSTCDYVDIWISP